MLFKNKIEYTKGTVCGDLRHRDKKSTCWYCGSLQGLLLWLRSLFMIYGAVTARIRIMPGDFFNLGISILMALLCTFLPNLMARSQMKKCKKRGLLGERTLRFTEHVLTMTYEKEGRSTDIPLEAADKGDGV